MHFAIDRALQAAALPLLRAHHSNVTIRLWNRRGRRDVLRVNLTDSWAIATFEGPVESIELVCEPRRRDLPEGMSLPASIAVRLNAAWVGSDERGQLTLWSADRPIAKLFSSEAQIDDIPCGLIHADFSRSDAIAALLWSSAGIGVRSIGLSHHKSLADLTPLTGLTAITSLDLSRCKQITDLSPLTGLTAITSLNLSGCEQITDLSPLAGLADITSLNLSGCEQITDLSPLTGLTAITSITLSGGEQIIDLSPLTALTAITSFTLSGCEQIIDLSPLASLTAITSLKFSSCRQLTNLAPLASLTAITSLEFSFCPQLSNLAPLASLTAITSLKLWKNSRIADLWPIAGLTAIWSLDVSGCEQITDLSPLAGLTAITSLVLDSCKQLTDLGPLASLTKITSLGLEGCERLTDLSPVAGLTSLTSLRVSGCERITDLAPLADLTAVTSLDFRGFKHLANIKPLASLTALSSLNLSGCERLTNLTGLAGLTALISLDISCCKGLSDLSALATDARLRRLRAPNCSNLALVDALKSLPSLEELDLSGCANVRDADALSGCASLRQLSYDETATRDGILLATATRRGDSDLDTRVATASASFNLSKVPDTHALRLVEGIAVLVETGRPLAIARTVVRTFRSRTEVPARTWERLFGILVRAPFEASSACFEAALANLDPASAERVLAPALVALGDLPTVHHPWARTLAAPHLDALARDPARARALAPAAAVFFHALGDAAAVTRWLDLGTVPEDPFWRDRVLVALVDRALRSDNLIEARRLLVSIETPSQRDAARLRVARALAATARLDKALEEMEALLDATARALFADELLAGHPQLAAEPGAAFSLLLALDGDPDKLGRLLAEVVTRAPDGELAARIAAAFAPPHAGVELVAVLDALLETPAVANVTKKTKLDALRARLPNEPRLLRAFRAHGTAGLLQAEGLVDADERDVLLARLLQEAP